MAGLWCGGVVLSVECCGIPAIGLGLFRFPKRLLQWCWKNISVHRNNCLKDLSLRGASNSSYKKKHQLWSVKTFPHL